MTKDELSGFSSTLPASWFREQGIYELERRAIYSKRWILVSHKSRFENPGQYATYDMAGYPFFIIKDRQNEIKAFLNICRHRAFPILHDKEGKANILACKYHGWSYGLGGKLAKAPRFETYEDFNKSDYSLYQLHLKVDVTGFIYVNLDSAEKPELSWEDEFLGVDTQDRQDRFKTDDYVFDHAWQLDECEFNWKTLVENYNECYHCSTAHPGIAPSITKDSKFDIEATRSYIKHLGEENNVGDIVASPTFMFPNSSTTWTRHFFYMMSIVPLSATTSSMRYEVYRNKNSSMEEFKNEVDFFKQVEREDKWLGNRAQSNLNTGAYVAGPLHPYMEKAVSHFEGLTRSALKEHFDKEKELGRELWPARRDEPGSQLEEDEAFCQNVCASAKEKDNVLAW